MISATIGVPEPGQPQPRSVRRALQAMRADLERHWTIGELAKIAGVSARTLQRQFHACYDKSPQSVLRDIGFERARQELLRGGAEDKVMDVALRCGFGHYGRFAVDYRRRFGETPSQTLKRRAVLAHQLAAKLPATISAQRRPTLAFERIEAGAGHEDVAASLADDLIAALTRSGFAVVAGAAPYRMHGAIRADAVGEARLTLQLIDHASGRMLWAQRLDGILGYDAEGCEQLATRVVAALQPHLRGAEIDRAFRKPDAELTAHDLALRAMPGVLSLDAEGNARAFELLQQALDMAPEEGLATALAAWVHAQRVVYHFSSNTADDRARGLALAGQVGAQSADATVLCLLGNALTVLDALGDADQVIRKALAVDGGSAWAWSRSGWLDVYRGDPASAIERFRIALDLAPQDPLAFNSMVGIGCAHFNAGRYIEAARWQQRALLEHPSALWVHRTMCPAYLLAGAGDEARRSMQALRAHYPELTLSEVRRGTPPLPDSYLSLMFEALSDAGLPA
ncbi:helix-turn-helix domain-containing protein [Bradyrhizobium sp. STM 3557]|uniref:helix-turn-helix domain-containing protein n=1 Tax=Bradyrhizobium sp. STM 3557 TaxID=578920 RepID=UPI003891182B